MIHPIADPKEMAEDLRAERQWNAAAREDLQSVLTENLRLTQLCSDLQRDLDEMRKAELTRIMRDFIRPMGVRGMVA